MSYEALSIDEKKRLAHVVLDLRNALTVGDPAPVVREMWERHQDPQPGDWVIETTTIYRLTYYPERYDEATLLSLWDGQFTRYLRTEDRPAYTPEEWADGDDAGKPIPTEQVHVCENPDGSEYAWTNAELATVPLYDSLRPWPAAVRDTGDTT